MKKITILLPSYNEQGSMHLLYDNMCQVAIDNAEYEWEFLMVNDGSVDATLEYMKEFHRKDARFCYLDLSRNYGKEIAMMAGLDYAKGDAVIIMDADMQHPISVIPEMIRYWEEGYQDIYAQRGSSKEAWFKKKTSQLYYKLLQLTTRIPIQENAGDFRLLDRICVVALRNLRETQRNTKGMYSWIGFRKKGIIYSQLERQNGESKWSFWQLLNLAIDGVTSYTTIPLRLASWIGIVVSLFAFGYLVYIIFSTLCLGEVVQGYPTLMVVILFLGGIQLISLGVIGEYLSRIFKETKNRPSYFVNTYNEKKVYAESDNK